MSDNPREQLDRIERDLAATKRSVDSIDRLLRGGHDAKELGLRSQVARLEDRNKRHDKLIGGLVLAVLGGLADAVRRMVWGG